MPLPCETFFKNDGSSADKKLTFILKRYFSNCYSFAVFIPVRGDIKKEGGSQRLFFFVNLVIFNYLSYKFAGSLRSSSGIGQEARNRVLASQRC